MRRAGRERNVFSMKAIQRVKVWSIVCSALFCALGVWMIVQPTLSAQALCYVLGALAIVSGVSKIVGYFCDDLYNLAFQFDLAMGIFVAAIGVLLVAHPAQVFAFFPVVIGLFVMIDGVFKLQTAVDARRFGLRNWWLILLGAAVSIVLSALLIFDPFGGGELLMTMIGVSLLIDGLENLFNVLYTVKIIKRAQKQTNALRDGDYRDLN